MCVCVRVSGQNLVTQLSPQSLARLQRLVTELSAATAVAPTEATPTHPPTEQSVANLAHEFAAESDDEDSSVRRGVLHGSPGGAGGVDSCMPAVCCACVSWEPCGCVDGVVLSSVLSWHQGAGLAEEDFFMLETILRTMHSAGATVGGGDGTDAQARGILGAVAAAVAGVFSSEAQSEVGQGQGQGLRVGGTSASTPPGEFSLRDSVVLGSADVIQSDLDDGGLDDLVLPPLSPTSSASSGDGASRYE